jgi:hypothetical protein
MGGGRENSISMLEAIARVEQMTGRKLDWRYVEEERKGGHIGYISDLSKFKNHFPKWKITRGLDSILDEMIRAATDKSLRVAAGRLKSDRRIPSDPQKPSEIHQPSSSRIGGASGCVSVSTTQPRRRICPHQSSQIRQTQYLRKCSFR